MIEVLVVHWSHKLNKERATWAALFIRNQIYADLELPDEIIFSGGKTLGKDKPSEAEEMKQIFLWRIIEIFKNNNDVAINGKWESLRVGQDRITLSIEDWSCDTLENAQNVMNLISWTQSRTKYILFSSLTHLPRISRVYKLFWAKAIKTSSLEAQYFKAGWEFRNSFWQHVFTPEFLVPVALEVPKFILTGFKPFQALSRKFAKKRLEK